MRQPSTPGETEHSDVKAPGSSQKQNPLEIVKHLEGQTHSAWSLGLGGSQTDLSGHHVSPTGSLRTSLLTSTHDRQPAGVRHPSASSRCLSLSGGHDGVGLPASTC